MVLKLKDGNGILCIDEKSLILRHSFPLDSRLFLLYDKRENRTTR